MATRWVLAVVSLVCAWGCGAPEPTQSVESMHQALPGSGRLVAQGGKLFAETPRAYSHFGQILAADGDTMVVGVPDDDDGGERAGAVIVFVREHDVWRRQQRLPARRCTVRLQFWGREWSAT